MKTVFELGSVFALLLGVKWLADACGLPGAGSLTMWCGIALATCFMRRRGSRWQDFGLAWPDRARAWLSTLGWALLAVVTILLAMGLIIEPLTTALGLHTPASAADRFMPLMGHPGRLLAYLLVVVWFGAALGEELLMRGYVLNRLADLFGRGKPGWSAAVVVQALTFGALHAYQGLHGIIATGVIGFVFALVYLACGRRLLPLVIAHGTINTAILVVLYLNNGVIE